MLAMQSYAQKSPGVQNHLLLSCVFRIVGGVIVPPVTILVEQWPIILIISILNLIC